MSKERLQTSKPDLAQEQGRLLILSGPSGSGKSTLCREAIPRSGAVLSVSATTRPPGKQEEEGVDYYFLSKPEFQKKIEAGEFLEHAEVFGHYYGTPAEAVRKKLKEGKTVVLEIDVQGAMQVFEKFPRAEGILILPPTMEVLKQRLLDRRREDEKTIQGRLAKARWEIEQARSSGRYRYELVNDDLRHTIDRLTAILNGNQQFFGTENHT